jgi:hypothetical protein
MSAIIAMSGCERPASTTASTGPYGGDLVPIKNGTAYAELVANPDTGEAMVHTWDKDLKTPHPVEKGPLTVGSDTNSTELAPHPTTTDPAGTCSRFYGHADRMRGGNIAHGWMMMPGDEKHSFDWQQCWQGGRMHGSMWEELGQHRHMGPGHGGPMMAPGHGPGEKGHE